jgi:transcription factor IIIB subunit 2
VKEKIWVTHNHDWLRLQQERILDKAMEDAMGKKKRQQKRKGGQSSMTNESPASTPAEASQRMLQRKNTRPAFSRHINYEKLKKIYGLPEDEDSNKSKSVSSESRSASEVPSVAENPIEPAETEVIEEMEEEHVDEVGEDDAEAGADEYVDADDYDEEDEEVDYDELGLEGNEIEDEYE